MKVHQNVISGLVGMGKNAGQKCRAKMQGKNAG
jgi:hypothetical protein